MICYISWTDSDLTMYSALIHLFDILLKDMQTSTLGLSVQHGALVKKICDIHLLFWHPTISLASVDVCD